MRQPTEAQRLGHSLGPVPPERQPQPRRTEGTPEQLAGADIQAFNDGVGARFYVGKYLLERRANEYRWLDNLRESPVPTALIWGLQDTPKPATHRQSDLVHLSRQEVGGEQLLGPADSRPLPPNGDEPRRDGRNRPHLPGGGDPRLRRTRTRSCGPWPRTGPRRHPSTWVAPSSRTSTFPGAVAYSPDGYSF